MLSQGLVGGDVVARSNILGAYVMRLTWFDFQKFFFIKKFAKYLQSSEYLKVTKKLKVNLQPRNHFVYFL